METSWVTFWCVSKLYVCLLSIRMYSMENNIRKNVPCYRNTAKKIQCKGTVYHDSSVEKPQNVCSICGESFLFQLQLKVHLETHDEHDDSEDDFSIEQSSKAFENGIDDIGSSLEELDTYLCDSINSANHDNMFPDLSSQTDNIVTDGNFESFETNKHNKSEKGNVTINTNNDHNAFLESTKETLLTENSENRNEMNINSEISEVADTGIAENADSEERWVTDEIPSNMLENEDENTMDFDYGTVEEVDKNTYVENDVNLGEVISQIKADEKDQATKVTVDASGREVIIMNKSIGKLNRKPHISKLRHECQVCGEWFQWPYQLKRHINIHNGYYPFQCDICGRKFDRASSLRDHGMVHRKDRPFKCDVCGVKFTLKNNLTKHMNRHTQKKIWQCEHCHKPFLQRDQLIAHLIVHKGEKPFPCEVCGKAFARKTNLKEHMITHSTEKNYPCDYCHKTFNKPYSKKIHMRHHLNTKPHKCDVCGASFSQSCALVTHIRRHTGERPFACPMCPRSFAQQSTLQCHVATHTGEKNFKCGVCTKAFLRKRCLTEHMRLHTGEKPFKCMMCDFTTATKVGLKRHVETHVKQLIRNADIDLTGLIDLPHLDENNRLHKTDFSDLSINKAEIADKTDVKHKPHETNSGGTVKERVNNKDADNSLIENTSLDTENSVLDTIPDSSVEFNFDITEETGNKREENPHSSEDIKQSIANGLQVQSVEKPLMDDGAESLVYLTGLSVIVGEMNKHCDGKFDPGLLDEGFVRHIINQSSLLSKNSHKVSKEPIRFECEICKMVLPHKKSMTEHKKVHQAEPEAKNHTCTVCDKRFLHRKSLLIHSRTHTGERPYKCDLCESNFTNKRALQRHYLNLHKGIVLVESAQEYAKALADRKEVEDLDSPNLGKTQRVQKKQKVQKVKKRKSKKVCKSRTKGTNINLDDDSFDSIEDLNSSDMTSYDSAIANVEMHTEDILKQAELAAKSICESLFAESTKHSNFDSESKSRSKRKNKSVRHVLPTLTNSSDDVLEKVKEEKSETQVSRNVTDGYTLLRQALQSVKPVQEVNNTVHLNSYSKHKNSSDNLKAEPLDPLVQMDSENQNEDDTRLFDENITDGQLVTDTPLSEINGAYTSGMSESIQNEYEVLRKTLQKSLNSVMLTPLIDDDT